MGRFKWHILLRVSTGTMFVLAAAGKASVIGQALFIMHEDIYILRHFTVFTIFTVLTVYKRKMTILNIAPRN